MAVMVNQIQVNAPDTWSVTPSNVEGSYIQRGEPIVFLLRPFNPPSPPAVDLNITFGEQITSMRQIGDWQALKSGNELSVLKETSDGSTEFSVSLNFNGETQVFCGIRFVINYQ